MATPGDIEIKPDHVIIWLDKHIGVHGNNEASKRVLANNADLDRPLENEYLSDVDEYIPHMYSEENKIKFADLIKSPLRLFTDENECIKCINDTIEAKKQPFVITSGEKGALLVPQIYKKLSGYIYIFCGQMQVHEKWTELYEKGIEIYDDDNGVFARVLSDIGIYYLLKGQNETSNQTAVIQYLYWARRLFTSASILDHINRKAYLNIIVDELTELRAPPSYGNDSDVSIEQGNAYPMDSLDLS